MSNYEYIRMPRKFTKVLKSKYNSKNDINVMIMPKGVIVGEHDLTNAQIYPPVMYDSDKEKDIVIGRYDKDVLEDNGINILFYNNGVRQYKEIDIEVLKEAIDKSVRDYYYDRANEIPQEKTRDDEYEY